MVILHLLLVVLSLLISSCRNISNNSIVNYKTMLANSNLQKSKDLDKQNDIDFLVKKIAIDNTIKNIQPNAKILKLKQKYPFTLIQDTDYGILTEADLWFYNKYDLFIYNSDHDISTENIKEPLNKTGEFYHTKSDHAYWQCFPKENIEFYLTEHTITSDMKKDAGYKDFSNDAILDLLVYVFIGDHIVIQNYYQLHHARAVTNMKRILDKWEKMLLHEDYVCLGGVSSKYLDYHEIINDNVGVSRIYRYYWDLYDIKTEHSCYSYFDNCKSRLQKFQQYAKEG